MSENGSDGQSSGEDLGESHRTRSPKFKLALLMVLAYGGLGAWWPILSVHLTDLGLSGRERGWIFGACPLASILVPFGMGQLADRYWPLQKCLAGILGMSSLLLLIMGLWAPTGFTTIFALMMLYWLIAAPSMGLTNTMAMRNLPKPMEQFAGVRMWGTVGWMAIGWLVAVIAPMLVWTHWIGRTGEAALIIAAITSAAAAVCCLRLPHTPPLGGGKRGPRANDMLDLLRDRSVLIYLGLAFSVSMTTPFMYQVIPPYLKDRGLPEEWVGAAMSLGQIPEILGLLCLPWCLNRFGYKTTMALGITCWMLRFGSLAVNPPLWLAIGLMPLHGAAVAFFTVSGQMYLDSRAPGHRRASSQTLNTVIASGAGSLLGCLLGGEVVHQFGQNYVLVFLVPTLINFVGLTALIVGFRPVRSEIESTTPKPSVAPTRSNSKPVRTNPVSTPAWPLPNMVRPKLDHATAS